MKRKDNIILCALLLMLFSCQNKDLYQAATKDNTTTADSNIDKSAPYIYPFSDEVKNATAVITIKTNKDIVSTNIKPVVPYLKYNKSWLLLLSQDDCKPSIYSRTWAKMNGQPVSPSETIDGKHDLYYDYPQLLNGDLPPTIIAAGTPLCSTDGAGRDVRFAFTATVLSEVDWMNSSVNVSPDFTKNYYRFFMKSGLVWCDVMDMMNYGVGLAFHNVAATDEKDESQVLTHYKMAQDSIMKHLAGRGCKMLAEPDGNKVYVSAALKFSDIQTMTAQNGSVILRPFQVTSDLSDVLINRVFLDNPDDYKTIIQGQLTISKEKREAVCIGVHSTDNAWMNFFQWVYDNYGKGGDDSVWFTSQEEYYEYNYYRIHGIQKVEQIDNRTLKLTVTLPFGDYFYYPSTTVNMEGLKMSDIVSIASDDAVTGLSYGDYDNSLMINMDCRKHLEELAAHYVEKYEKNKTNVSNKSDAIYFVNLLKSSSVKTALLERISQ